MTRMMLDSGSSPGVHDEAVASFELSLLDKAPATTSLYLLVADKFMSHAGVPAGDLTRNHVRAYLRDLLHGSDAVSKSTVNVYARSLRRYLKFLNEEGINEADLVGAISVPKPDPKPPLGLTREDVDKVVAVIDGNTMWQRRDAAIVLLLADTGMRAHEVAGLLVEDVLLRERQAVIRHSKTAAGTRVVGFGTRTARALDRYLRFRRQHALADKPYLFIGKKGQFGTAGIGQMVRAAGRKAGVEGLHAHALRHYAIDQMLRSGVPESVIATIVGHRSTRLIGMHYGRTMQADRALRLYRSPMDT